VGRSDPAELRPYAERIELAAREIARYVDEHPNASDTFDGVRDWWVPELCEAVGPDVVRSAVDRLVTERVLEARRLPGDTVIYGRGRKP
jgi:hypothetical protein